MLELLEISENLIAKTNTNFKRYLFDQVDWSDRLIGIKGSRGTGKTTLVLQHIKEKGLSKAHAAYFSLDELYFTSNSIIDTAKEFYQKGGRTLVLDEVHKYRGWAREIKNLYDRYDDLQIIFTGSSIIDISREEGDLSRRALIYELNGLSYREYLSFFHGINLPVLTLDQILDSTQNLRTFFPSDFKPLENFKEYLKVGYYPFSGVNKESYYLRLRQTVRVIVEFDMAEMKGFDIRNAKKILQLLYVIAQQVPFKPNISSLSEKTQIHRNSMVNYLHYLNEARLIDLLYPQGISVAVLQKPEKIFLNNTNLLYALSETEPEIGTVREVYFNSQLKVNHKVSYSPTVDFLVDQSVQFEIGGKNKSSKQIQNASNSWVVKDDLEFPVANHFPLWVFGFLY